MWKSFAFVFQQRSTNICKTSEKLKNVILEKSQIEQMFFFYLYFGAFLHQRHQTTPLVTGFDPKLQLTLTQSKSIFYKNHVVERQLENAAGEREEISANQRRCNPNGPL